MAALKRPCRAVRSSPLDPAHLAPHARYKVPTTEARNSREITRAVEKAVRIATKKVAPATNLALELVAATRNYAEILIRIQDHEFGKLYGEACGACLWTGDDGQDDGKWVAGVKDPTALPSA